MKPRQTNRAFAHIMVTKRLAVLQQKFGFSHEARQMFHNEIESAARFWFIQGGGLESDFETKFNEK